MLESLKGIIEIKLNSPTKMSQWSFYTCLSMLVCAIPVSFICLTFKAKVLGSTCLDTGLRSSNPSSLIPSFPKEDQKGVRDTYKPHWLISKSFKASDFLFAVYLCLGSESTFMIPNFKMYSNFTQDWLLRYSQTNCLSCKIFIFNVSMLDSLFSAKRSLQKSLRENI